MTKFDFVLVDAMNLSYRSWWKVKDLKTSKGIPTGLEYGFIRNLLSLTREFQPADIVLAWDGRPTRCLSLYTDYKANRVKPKEHTDDLPWGPRLERLKKALSYHFLTLSDPNTEADEEIARFVNKHRETQTKILIASTDDDLKQLVSENVYSYPFKDEVLSLEDVEKYFGVHPSKVPLLRSISGDTSDNIPGIPRIPTEVKIRLASQCSNIPELLNLIDNIEDLTVTQSQKLKSGKDIIRRNYDLMNLRDQSVEPSFYGKKDSSNNEILDLCRELELNSLLDHKSWDLVRKCQSVQNESSEVLDL